MMHINEQEIEHKGEKIGLITFHRTANFGSSLQMYGLYRKIISLGYSCEVIDYRCPAIEARENLNKTSISLNPKKLFVQLYVRPVQRQKAKKLEQFNKDHVCMTKAYYPDSIAKAQDSYSKLISGSDIIWGRDITDNDYTYFLGFGGPNVKKYAFSSSVGNYDMRGDEDIVSKLLSKYSRIAVREEEAVNWVKKIAGIDADWVCDPTMLLSSDEWEKIINPKQVKDDYVLIYFDDDGHKCVADAIEYAKRNAVQVRYINYGFPKKNVINARPTTLEEFLGLIKYARCVFTASYHGLLFSLYFHREVMYYTRAHSTRMNSLSKQLDLLDHCGNAISIDDYSPVNYAIVDEKIKQFRERSTDILKGMLSE